MRTSFDGSPSPQRGTSSQVTSSRDNYFSTRPERAVTVPSHRGCRVCRVNVHAHNGREAVWLSGAHIPGTNLRPIASNMRSTPVKPSSSSALAEPEFTTPYARAPTGPDDMKELRRCTDFFCLMLLGLTWMVLGAITCESTLGSEPVPCLANASMTVPDRFPSA